MIRRLMFAAVPILAGWTSAAYGAVAVADHGRLWRDHIVPYAICEIADSADASQPTSGCEQGGRPLAAAEAAKVREAVQEWNSLLGAQLRFVAVDGLSRSQRGVLFSRSKREVSCSSDRIGRPRTARRTNVKLGSRCNGFASFETPVGTILHEMMHVAGFYHEHQRPDRDAYLQSRVPGGLFKVLFDVGGALQWAKGASMRSMHVLTPYDFQSIMHYPIKDPKKAVLTFEGLQRLEAQGLSIAYPGRRDGMSPDDIAGLKMLYGAKPNEALAKSESVAKMEAFSL